MQLWLLQTNTEFVIDRKAKNHIIRPTRIIFFSRLKNSSHQIMTRIQVQNQGKHYESSKTGTMHTMEAKLKLC